MNHKNEIQKYYEHGDQKEQTKAQLDYDSVIQKAWSNFKSGDPSFSKTAGLLIGWIPVRTQMHLQRRKI